MVETAAIITCIILALLALFQAALIIGAPLGQYAWGGAHKILPPPLRAGSLIAIILYLLFGLTILEQAHVIDLIMNDDLVRAGAWIVTIYFVIGIVMNGISRSKNERLVMTPVAAALAITCLLVVTG